MLQKKKYFTLINHASKDDVCATCKSFFIIIILHVVKYFIVIAKTKGKTQVLH